MQCRLAEVCGSARKAHNTGCVMCRAAVPGAGQGGDGECWAPARMAACKHTGKLCSPNTLAGIENVAYSHQPVCTPFLRATSMPRRRV